VTGYGPVANHKGAARARGSRRSGSFALLLLIATGSGCATGPSVVTKRVDGRVVVTRPIAPAAYEHVTRALLFEEDNRLAEAADELERALTFDDEAPEILAHLAELDTELGKLDEAQAALQRAEKLGPTVEGALAAAGLAEARHDDAGLEAALAQAVARADEDQAPQHLEDAHLARAAERLGALDADGAFATLQALVDRLPASARGRRQLAAVAWATGKMSDAEAQLRLLLEQDANDLDAQLLLAALLAASDRPREAKAAFEQALSRSEEAVEIAEMYLKWLMDRGDVEEARRLADALVVSDPTSGEAAERTCRVERAVRRPERAKAAADHARAHGAPAAAMTSASARSELALSTACSMPLACSWRDRRSEASTDSQPISTGRPAARKARVRSTTAAQRASSSTKTRGPALRRRQGRRGGTATTRAP